MKKSLFVVVLVTLALVLVACGGGGDSLVGKWESVYMSDGEATVKMVGAVKIEFKDDNTVIGQAGGDADTHGTWKKDGDKYILDMDGEENIVTFENGLLALTFMGDAKMYFSKDAAKFDKFPEGTVDMGAEE